MQTWLYIIIIRTSAQTKKWMATGTEEVLEGPLSEVHDYNSILVQKE